MHASQQLLRKPGVLPLARIFALAALAFALHPAQVRAEAVSLGAHAFWYRGPVRSMALAGATVAETRGGSMVDNPAAAGFQKSLLYSTLSYGQPLDQSAPTPSSVALGQSFRMLGATIMPFDAFSIGATYQTLSFRSENKPDSLRTLTYTDNISEVDFATAYRIGENISFGVAFGSADSVRDINLSLQNAGAFSAQTRATGDTSFKLGVQTRLGSALSLGAFYRQHSTLKLSHSGSESLEFFDASYHPQILQVGTVVRPFIGLVKSSAFSLQNFALALQVDQYKFPSLPKSGKIYSGQGAVFGTLESSELNTKETYIPRIGVELPVVTTWFFSTYTRVGVYNEPAYLKNGKERLHTTAGALVRFWYLAFEGAIDTANKYENWNYGVGIDFDLR